MSAVATSPRTRSRAAVFGHYLGRSLALALRDWEFLVFVITLPTVMYLFFSGIYGDQEVGAGVRVRATMMVTMAAYGGLGAAMSAGAQIQAERTTGWLRQLMITSLRPGHFLTAKVVVAVGIMIPALAAVFIAGYVRGVRLDAATWAACGALLLAALLPMIIFGLVIGLWFKPQAANAATTMAMLVLSMVGGLWFPLEMMPDWLQSVGRALPSYWAGQIGMWPLHTGDAFPWRGVAVIAVWTLALVGLGFLGYRYAVRQSQR